VAAGEAINRLIHPQPIDHLAALALACVIGFIGNEIAAQIRLRAGRNLAPSRRVPAAAGVLACRVAGEGPSFITRAVKSGGT
jgi:hypothetical protein